VKTPPTCDLHVHSRYSDGTLDPAAIVHAAAEAGLAAVSVTDHDTAEGQAEALDAGRESSIEVLTGIELSIEEGDLDLHILGYGFDHRDRTLLRRIAGLKRMRIERVAEMVDLMGKSGVPLTLDEVLAEAGEGSVGRPHVAKVLLRRGLTGGFQEAFDRWIGNGGPCYVPKIVLDLEEVVDLIRGAGGVPVWAHPGGAVRDGALLHRIVSAGVRGLEAWHPNHSGAVTALVIEEARRLGLLCTGGSDYHFDEAMKSRIGGITVPYESVMRIRVEAGGHLT
jgi:hypothetical protein